MKWEVICWSWELEFFFLLILIPFICYLLDYAYRKKLQVLSSSRICIWVESYNFHAILFVFLWVFCFFCAECWRGWGPKSIWYGCWGLYVFFWSIQASWGSKCYFQTTDQWVLLFLISIMLFRWHSKKHMRMQLRNQLLHLMLLL